MHLLVVCHGSSCRSPMAKALLDRELADLRVSATVHARALMRAEGTVAEEAVEEMLQEGLNIADHVPTLATEEDARQASLILVMDQELLAEAQRRWPSHAGKIHLILDFAYGARKDVCDPYGREKYTRTRAVLRQAARAIASRLRDGES